MKQKLFTLVFLLISFLSCGALTKSDKEIETPFSGNPVQPLVPIPLPAPGESGNSPKQTQYCFPDSSGQFTNELTLTMGKENDYVWSQGGGCIFRPIRLVWAVTHNQPLMVWEEITSSSFVVRSDLPPGVTHFYEVKYFVDDIIDVNWTMNWYHSIREGTREAPTQILINYKKVKGTRYIPYWEGTLLLHEVAPGITSITMRDQINASRTNPENSADAIRDVIRKLREGDPNWAPVNSFNFHANRRLDHHASGPF